MTFLPPSPVRDRKEFVRAKYLRFKEGVPVIVRILDDTAVLTVKHWIAKSNIGIVCLGDKCPICDSNTKIRAEHPTDYKKIRGYSGQQFRYTVNVFDRTLVIVDPEGGEEYYATKGKFPTLSSDGERSLVGVEPRPSNTIKIMERGRQLFEQISVVADDARQEHGKAITEFDLKLTTLGAGQKMIITPVPVYDTPGFEFDNDSKYNLDELGIRLSPEEIIKVLNGVSLSDVYSARRARGESEIEGKIESSLADVSDRVSKLFADDEILEEAE